MSTTWILIANSSQAQLYSTHKVKLFKANGHDGDYLNPIDSFTHDESRKKAGELVTDKLGNYHSGSAGHGSFAESSDPKLVEVDRFARELAIKLDQGRVENAYDDLIIVAPAHFRGLIQKHLNGQTEKLITQTIEKDYTHFKTRELVGQLKDYL